MNVFRPPLIGAWAGGRQGDTSFIDSLTILHRLDAQVAGSVMNGASAAADGATITQWTAVTGANATQATSGKRPTYDADGINGHPCIRFSGTKVLEWLAAPLIATGYTILVVAELSGSDSDYRRLVCTVGNAPEGTMCLSHMATTSNVMGTYGGGFQSGTKAIHGRGVTVSVWTRGTAALGPGKMYVNSEAAGTYTKSEGSGTPGTIGAFTTGTDQGVTGTVGEVIIVQGELSAADILRATDELLAKWAAAAAPETLVFVAGGQSNATQAWADGIEDQLKVLYGHNRIRVAWNQQGGCPLYYWWHDNAPEALYNVGSNQGWNPEGAIGLTEKLATVMSDIIVNGGHPRIAGVFWFQGESDAVDDATRAGWVGNGIGDTGPNQWLYYSDRFNQMMAQIRDDFHLERTPKFCLCMPSYSPLVSGDNYGVVQADLDLVRDVQVEMGQQSNGVTIDPLLTVGATKQDKVHWNFVNGSGELIGTDAANAFVGKFGLV